MAKKYELVLILDPQAGDTQLETAVENYKKRLEAAGAEVEQVVKWGLRKLAYTSIALRQRQQGFYVLYQFSADSERLGPVEEDLKLDESVLRHLVVAVPGEFLSVPQLAPENVYIYQSPDRGRDRRGPRRDRDRREDGPPRPDRDGRGPAEGAEVAGVATPDRPARGEDGGEEAA